MHSDESYVLRALKAGAKAYLLKNSAEADLIQAAIGAVAGGQVLLQSCRSGRMLLEDYMRQVAKKEVEDSYDLLTAARERDPAVSRRRQDQQRSRWTSSNSASTPSKATAGNILAKAESALASPELILYAVRKGIIS